MKKCPYCAEDIQDAAIVCKHCGRDLKLGASHVQVVPAKPKTSIGTLGCAGILGLLALGWCVSILNPTPPASSTMASTPASGTPAAVARAVPARQSDVLELLSSHGYEQYDYMIVEGRVKNITDQSLQNVEAVASWFSKTDDFISSDDTLIEYNPLLPAQTSPFKVMTRRNPQMERYNVEFKRLMGGTLPTKDSRKSK